MAGEVQKIIFRLLGVEVVIYQIGMATALRMSGAVVRGDMSWQDTMEL
jgi:hypothetical protein